MSTCPDCGIDHTARDDAPPNAAADPRNPKEGDRFVCARGEVRIDRVANGWVYLCRWEGAEETGVLARMQMAEWLGAVETYGLEPKAVSP